MSELPNFNFDLRFHPEEPGRPENFRTPEEAKRYEAREIAQALDALWALFSGRVKGEGSDMMDADAALDNVANLALSLGQRDPEMVLILIEELEAGPGPHDEVEFNVTNHLRAMLGMPPWSPPAGPPTEHQK
jgi:hypothetical protein